MEEKIIVGFDVLISEIDTVIIELNGKSADLINKNQYQAGRVCIGKAEQVTEILVTLKGLLVKWQELDVAAELEPENSAVSKATTTSTRIKRGLSHDLNFYKMPILEVLARLGRSGKRKLIFDEVKTSLADQMNEFDLQTTPGSSRSFRWVHAAAKAGDQLENEGCITRDPSKGTWKITEKGLTVSEDFKTRHK